MSKKETGGPAFPQSESLQYSQHITGGMTLRQYAAIKLKVPDSGVDWLDEMIEKSIKDDFAGKAMQGMLSENGGGAISNDKLATWAYDLADETLKAREA